MLNMSSEIELLSIDELFEKLKDSSNGLYDENTKNTQNMIDDYNKDVLSVDDSEMTQRESQFKDIEMKLLHLPKMENAFDSLKQEKTSRFRMPDTQYKGKKVNISEKWFTLPKHELSNEMKRDLMLLKHRAALDPKRHYKKNKWEIPERFQMGTIIEGEGEFFSSRLNKKQRKSTILEGLMVDDNTNKFFKRKYTEVQKLKTSGKKGFYKKVKSKRNKY